MKEKSKHAGLVQENSFGAPFFARDATLRMVKGTAMPNTCS